MSWLRNKRHDLWFERGRADEFRKQRDDLLRASGQRPGEDTEPVDLDPDEWSAYQAGRQSARGYG